MSSRFWWRLVHRLLVGGGVSLRHVASGLAAQAGIQQPVFGPQRPTLAVGVSIAP